MLHLDLADKTIKAFYKKNNILGFEFLEKLYENAMVIELRKLPVNQDFIYCDCGPDTM